MRVSYGRIRSDKPTRSHASSSPRLIAGDPTGPFAGRVCEAVKRGHHSSKSHHSPRSESSYGDSSGSKPPTDSGYHGRLASLGGHKPNKPLRNEYNVPPTKMNRDSHLPVAAFDTGGGSNGALAVETGCFPELSKMVLFVCAQVGVRMPLALPRELGSAGSVKAALPAAARPQPRTIASPKGATIDRSRGPHCLVSRCKAVGAQVMLKACCVVAARGPGNTSRWICSTCRVAHWGAARAHRFLPASHLTRFIGRPNFSCLPTPGLEDDLGRMARMARDGPGEGGGGAGGGHSKQGGLFGGPVDSPVVASASKLRMPRTGWENPCRRRRRLTVDLTDFSR